MAQVNLGDYKNLYFETAKEYLEKISVSLNQLLNDISNKDALNSLHIASHSLKSQSQVIGFEDIAEICLGMEKIADEALRQINPLTQQIISDMKINVSRLEEMLKQVQHDNENREK